MNGYEKTKKYVEKLQKLPEKQRLSIFFVILAIFGLIMFFLSLKLTQNNISRIKKSVNSINFKEIGLNNQDFAPKIPDLNIGLPIIEINNTSSNQSINIVQ